ncbi:MAG: YhjD/YihY/BrkB family envelope integrity protein [Myxococcales bacterium]|nr:YihY/virulence factor BrkB family protein [Myxococcota bacterium]MDW8280978.1 YhjD/YihY/BrkB family envelope integrity protein [Myxococcales bacterium]
MGLAKYRRDDDLDRHHGLDEGWPADIDPPSASEPDSLPPPPILTGAQQAPAPTEAPEGTTAADDAQQDNADLSFPSTTEDVLSFAAPPRPSTNFLPVRALALLVQRWRSSRCGQLAASLAFHSLLGLLPLFAIALALLQAGGYLAAPSPLLLAAVQKLLPYSVEARPEAAQSLTMLIGHVPAPALGAAGFLVALLLALLLFLQVESVWSEIWSTTGRRTFFQRFLLFNAALTLLPMPVTAALWHAVSLGPQVAPLPLLGCVSLSVLTFTLLNRVLPPTRVRWGAALLGGLVTALLVEWPKLAIGLYVSRVGLATLMALLGLVPLLILWVYLFWLGVLLGAALAQAIQTLRDLDPLHPDRSPKDAMAGILINDEWVLRLLGDIAQHFASGRKALPAAVLWQRHGLPEQVVRQMLARMEERDLIIGVDDAYLPARPLDRIQLDDVLQTFRVASAREPSDALGRLLQELEDKTRQQLRGRTLADLV